MLLHGGIIGEFAFAEMQKMVDHQPATAQKQGKDDKIVDVSKQCNLFHILV